MTLCRVLFLKGFFKILNIYTINIKSESLTERELESPNPRVKKFKRASQMRGGVGNMAMTIVAADEFS